MEESRKMENLLLWGYPKPRAEQILKEGRYGEAYDKALKKYVTEPWELAKERELENIRKGDTL